MQRVSNPYRQITRRFISLGAVSWVYQIDDEIALKFPRQKKLREFVHENSIYDKFESHHSPCPHIIQSFYRTEVANFLQFLPHGSLHDRLQSNQTRDGDRVISVDRFEDRRLSERWAAELCAANAWLETLGVVHGDLRPANMLLDQQNHLKLADFDSVASIGQKSLGSASPWARLRPESKAGGYGLYGPETEQFAIGSMVYYMVRGFEPYGGPEQNDWAAGVAVDLWKGQRYPDIREDDALERLALNCWRGSFVSIHCLKEAVMDVPGSQDMAEAVNWTAEYRLEMRQKCEALLGQVAQS
ncbi:AGC/DMPK protein kinase [Colletotrichum cuscutae]|uniref:EKC/KEOPS complex subunit BUD32 n=1 Tax=Colletotrichum cuscutae TaxID=1209917 RepID=A0AAI9Y4V2_9PEZI|nr:AGC/DMPK protein kinase [Colletotrichum cuscutae]